MMLEISSDGQRASVLVPFELFRADPSALIWELRPYMEEITASLWSDDTVLFSGRNITKNDKTRQDEH